MLCLFIHSCVQEKTIDHDLKKTEAEAYTELHEQIALLNAQYSVNFKPDTRGRFGLFLRRLWKVLRADLTGAVHGYDKGNTGMIITGICHSIDEIMKRDDSIGCIDDDSEGHDDLIVLYPDNDWVLTTDDFLYTAADSIGYFHNKIILDIYNENQDGFYEMNEDQYIAKVINKVCEYTNSMIPFRLRDQMIQDIKSGLALFRNLADNQHLDAVEALQAIHPSRTEEINIIKTYCESIELMLDDKAALINYTTEFRK